MEKTVQITLGNTLFTLTESAYDVLRRYLDSLTVHFSAESDSVEIIRDIESRIAEKLLERKVSIASEKDVELVIGEMGSVSQFETEEKEQVRGQRKLYRDIDNAMITGVASGIAAYLDIGVTWIRLAFLASIFFGGAGIIMYLLLSILIPAAKTTSQKLEMRGDVVTLDSITRMVKDRINETAHSGAVERTIGAITRAFGRVATACTRIVGVIIAAGSFFSVLGLSVAFAVMVMNWDTPYVSDVIHEITTPTIFWAGIIAGYLTILIPLVLVFTLGIRFMRRKSTLPAAIGFGLIGVWCLSVIAVGAIATRVAGDYYVYTSSHPSHQEVSQTLELEPFTSIDVERSQVIIASGSTQSVTVNGTQSSLSRIKASVEDGKLILRTEEMHDTCVFFCKRNTPSVVIQTPAISGLVIKNGTVTFEHIISENLDVVAESSSLRGDLSVDTLSFSLERSNVRSDITAETLSLHAKESYVSLEGDVQDASVTLRRSTMSSDMLIVENATLSAYQSHVQLWVDGDLQIEAKEGSSIENNGKAELY